MENSVQRVNHRRYVCRALRQVYGKIIEMKQEGMENSGENTICILCTI